MSEERSVRGWIKIGVLLIIVILGVYFGISSLFQAGVTVPSGNRGILMNFGNPVQVLEPGLHWIQPFVQSVELMDVRIHGVDTTESAASFDLQDVTTEVTVNYQVDPTAVIQVWNAFKREYEATVIVPAIKDAVKAATAQFTAEQLVTEREVVKGKVQEIISGKMVQYNIIITSVSMTDFKFSDAFTKAIEDKVVKIQEALAAQNQLAVIQFQAQQQIIQAEAARNATIINANATAQALIINATAQYEVRLLQALAESQYVREVSGNMTQLYIYYTLLKEWNGVLPYIMGSSNSPFIFLLFLNSTSTTSSEPIGNQTGSP